jgi:hypothetical protein
MNRCVNILSKPARIASQAGSIHRDRCREPQEAIVQAHITFPPNIAEPTLPGQVFTAAHQFRVHGCLWLENSFARQKVLAMQDQFLREYANQDLVDVQKNCLQVGDKRYHSLLHD